MISSSGDMAIMYGCLMKLLDKAKLISICDMSLMDPVEVVIKDLMYDIELIILHVDLLYLDSVDHNS